MKHEAELDSLMRLATLIALDEPEQFLTELKAIAEARAKHYAPGATLDLAKRYDILAQAAERGLELMTSNGYLERPARDAT
jgi:hypothetical protein